MNVTHERRPSGPYYEDRGLLFSQGDIFRDVPLAFPNPGGEIVVSPEATSEDGGGRAFLSGPLDFGPAILLTPTCSMRGQRQTGPTYSHSVRTLAPIRTATELSTYGILDASRRGLAEKRDGLINYLWLPASPERGIAEDSLALLYMPVTLSHQLLEGQRCGQLTFEAARQLQKKLVWFTSSVLLTRDDFDPPMD